MAFTEQQIIPYQAVESIGLGPVLVLASHPDNEVLGCGGAILGHVAAGDIIRVVILTDGGYGAADADEYVLQRRQESLQAAAILGYGVPVFWDLPDRGLEYGEFLIRRLSKSIEETAAALVYAPSWWEAHPDHRALALAAAEAVRRCQRPLRLVLYEIGVPLSPNILLDISGFLERKQQAMACFTRQLAHHAHDRQILALNRFRAYTLPETVQAAEAYRVLTREALVADSTEIRSSLPPMVAEPFPAAHQGQPPPLVSVIIRSMNRSTLNDALQSLARQTYPHIEIVVVDAKGEGHSPLPAWCGRFPLRLVSLAMPLRRSRAANMGLDHVQGKYAIFLDDDDYFDPDHIATLVAALQGQTRARCVYSGVRVEYYEGDQLQRSSAFNEPFDRMKLLGRNFIPIHAALFEHSLCAEGCRFDESLDTFEDWDFWIAMSQRTDFLHIENLSACYRNYGHSGLGEHADPHLVITAMAALFNKWKGLWSGTQVAEMIQYRERLLGEREYRLGSLQGQLRQKDLELAEAHQTIAVRQGQLQHAQQRLVLLENQLSSKDSELANKDSELQQRDAEIARREAVLADKDAALAGREAELADRDARIAYWEAALADSHTEFTRREAELEARLADKDVQIGQKTFGLAQQAQYLAELEARRDELEARAAWLQAKVDELHQSTSWKVTGPLRYLSQALRGSYRRQRSRAIGLGLRLAAGVYRHTPRFSHRFLGFCSYLILGWRFEHLAHYTQWLRGKLNPAAAALSEFGNPGPIDRYLAWQQLNLPRGHRLLALSRHCGCLLFPRELHEECRDFAELAWGCERVSFDVFDTLIERLTVRPEDIFERVGHAARDRFATPAAFARARIAAESAARAANGTAEVTLDEIYAELRLARNLSPAETDPLQALEIATELALLRPKASGRQLYRLARMAGLPVSLISDTYLPRPVLEQALDQAGYKDWDRLFISNESRHTKHYGPLYAEVLEFHGLAPAALLHVGDNSHSDGKQAEAQGIRSLLVGKTRELGPAERHRPEAEDTLEARLIEGLVVHRYGHLRDRRPNAARFLGSPYFLGYAALGPVLLGFAQWLSRWSRHYPVASYAFLARDGYYLKAAYDIVAGHLGNLPPSRYLAASRILATLATLTTATRVLEVARVDHFPMPIGKFLRHRFGFTAADLARIPDTLLAESGLDSLESMVTSEDTGKLQLVEALQDSIIGRSRAAAERYRTYLLRSGIDFSATPLVDIGYSGTSQQSIGQLLGVAPEGLYFITSPRAGKLTQAGLKHSAWWGREVGYDHPFFRHIQNWELFLSATHGSFIDIDACEFRPLAENRLHDPHSLGVLANLRHGALDFVSEFMQAHPAVFADLDLVPALCTRTLLDYFHAPEAEDCAAFGKIVFEDRFGGDIRPLLVHPAQAAGPDAEIVAGSVWREASTALSGREVITPWWPCQPAVIHPRGENPPAPLIDEVTEDGIRPACESPAYRRNLGPDGVPRHDTLPVAIGVLLPVREADSFPAMIDSLQRQLSRGWSVAVVQRPGTPVRLGYRDFPIARHELKDGSKLVDLAAALEPDWILLSDGRTCFEPTALAEFSGATEGADIVIADDDVLDAEGRRSNPHFKPEFSPELLLSTDYFGGAWLVRKALLENLTTTATEPRAWLWEIALKLAQPSARVVRIPRVLTHRRPGGDDPAFETEQRQILASVAGQFAGRGMPCQVKAPAWGRASGKRVCRPEFPDQGPAVAILIPTKNQAGVVRRCLESLLKLTTYRNYHLYLIDNESDDDEALRYFQSLKDPRLTLLRIGNPPGGFSYSHVNNRAVEQTRNEPYLLFLNNDTEVIEPRWLSQMVGWQRLPGVGSVGALLYFPNQWVQHAGITHKLLANVLPAPSFKLLQRDDPGYQDYVRLARDSAAQTAACLLTPREIFLAQGGFDETDFNVAYNDCDYGFKLTRQGLRNVFCPDAKLYHHEGLSRGAGKGNDKPQEEAAFIRKYLAFDDPYYSPNLALGRTDFAIQPTSPLTAEVPRLRLALVTHNLNYEGAPLVLLEILKGLVRSNRVATALILSLKEGPLREAYESLGGQVLILGESMDFFQEGEDRHKALGKAASILEAVRSEVVLANTVLSWWAVEAAQLVRIPSVWVIHESEPPFIHLEEHNRLCAMRGRTALAWPYRVVFVSWATREVFRELETHGNFHTIYNGFDEAEYTARITGKSRTELRTRLGLDDTELMVLLLGSVCERKAQLDLITALPLLERELIGRLKVFIVGDYPSPYSIELHRRVELLDPELRARLRIVPLCKEVEDYLLSADIMVSTARIEAFPKVIQEGMFFGLAMAVAPVFGIQEQLQDEVSALFFEPGNCRRLAEQLGRLIRDEKLRQRLAANAKVSLGRFPTIEAMAEEYGRILQEAWLTGD